MTVLGPVRAIVTAASPLPKRAGLVTTSPQAVKSSTKNVLKTAQVSGRQTERMLSEPQGHCGIAKKCAARQNSLRRRITKQGLRKKEKAQQ
jgi:hypothetical protein